MASSPALVYIPAAKVPGEVVEAALNEGETSLSNCILWASFDAPADSMSYSKIVLVGAAGTPVNGSVVSDACKRLASGGQAVLVQPSIQASSKRLFVMCGLTSITEEKKDVKGVLHTVMKGTKPAVELGSTTPLELKSNVWKIDAASGGNDDLIDEDDLLTEEDRAPVIPKAGCATSKSACENCTCGRAEAEAKGVKLMLTQDMIDNPQSNCGNCGRGDGFRCATCPYRGLPAFEPGRKIELPPDFLMADA